MSEKLDVLAVMEGAADLLDGDGWNGTARELRRLRPEVEKLLGAMKLAAEGLDSAAKCVDPPLAILLEDRAMFARHALARVQS